jgi:phage gp46-like protein
MDINVRIAEGCKPQPQLLWDTVWNSAGGFGDWAVAAPGEPLNCGGLRAMRPLSTAVALALFTDKACPANHPLAPADGDLRGWWGDGVDVRADLGEAPLGSWLWLLERQVLDPAATPRWAISFALDALSPMIGQQSVVNTAAQAYVDRPSRLDLAVQLYGQDGALIYSQRYNDIWSREFSPLPAAETGAPTPPKFVPSLRFVDRRNSQYVGPMGIP